MKYLVKFFVVVIAFTMTTELFAQNFGVRAGLNLSNMLMKDDDDTYSDEFTMNPGFHVGPTVEFPINEIFSFESGLLLTTKGFKISDKETFMDETYEYEQKLNLFSMFSHL